MKAPSNSPSGCWARPAAGTSLFRSRSPASGSITAANGSTSCTLRLNSSSVPKRNSAETLTPTTTNRLGTRAGDPLNLVVIGDFGAILSGFGARWDETETISLRSCLRTVRAFTLGSSYRYSPVSPLYVEGRSQDFALQRARHT